jgi:hypothetical protein
VGKPGAVVGNVVQLEVLGGGGLKGPEEIDCTVGQLGQCRVLVNARLCCYGAGHVPGPRGSVPGSTGIVYDVIGEWTGSPGHFQGCILRLYDAGLNIDSIRRLYGAADLPGGRLGS